MTLERTLALDGGGARDVSSMIDRVADIRRQIATLEAAETRALAELGDALDGQLAALPASQRATALPLRDASARLGARVRLSDRAIHAQILQAQQTLSRFPTTMKAWEDGEISRAHVRVITDAGEFLDDAAARERFETEALRIAGDETAARMRSIAEQLAERYNPIPFAERHRRAREHRKVRLIKLTDGMSRLSIDTPSVLAHAVMDRATRIARLNLSGLDYDALRRLLAGATSQRSAVEVVMAARARTPLVDDAGTLHPGHATLTQIDLVWQVHVVGGEIVPVRGARRHRTDPPSGADRRTARTDETDERTLDQRRADVVTELLLTGVPTDSDSRGMAAVVGQVQITVPVLTLLADDTTPGGAPAELAGHGPIDPATARALTAEAPGWDRVLTHPVTGTVLEVDRYQPTAAQRRYLRARDRRCRFPGCSIPAKHCDHDHTDDYARGGRTHICNLACICRRHHVLKHHTCWKVIHLPGGVLEWHDPDGRVYTDTPPPAVAFVPADLTERIRSRHGLYLTDTTPAPF